MDIRQQTSRDKLWNDETGANIPYSRITPLERKTEKIVAGLARTALSLNRQLSEFKTAIREKTEELYNDFLKANGGKIGKNKGGATFYLFDRSVKVEVSVNEPIKFDENLISLAKQKIDEYLDSKLVTDDEVFRGQMIDAFSRSHGQLDVNKILRLRKWAPRVKDKSYHEAIALIDQAITRPKSKEYFRVWIKDESGAYKDITLQFSNL